MTVKVSEKKETNELWILRCRLSTKELAKKNGVLERVRARTKKDTKVAKMGGKNPWPKGSARTEAKGKRKRWQGRNQCMMDDKTGHIAAWCRKGDNKHLYAIDGDDSETLKKQMTMKKICKRGVCWKKVKMSSGNR